jgi:hypothetical protein
MAASFRIGPPEDKESILDLFALVLDKAYEERSPFCVQQGTLLQWAHDPELRPTIEDLKASLHGTPPDGHRPLLIVDATVWQGLQGGPFLRALELAEKAAPYFGVSSAPEIYRVLAAVAQTVGSADQKFKDENNKLYRERIKRAIHTYKKAKEGQVAVETYEEIQRLAQPSQGVSRDKGVTHRIPHTSLPRGLQLSINKPEKWPSMAVQDSCEFLSNNRIALWHASNVGPSYAQKRENQDATFALSVGPRVIFALADGVSTSYGSRFSAVAIVSSFCDNLQRLIKADAKSRSNSLREAASATQVWLDNALSFLLANPQAPEWSDVRGCSSNLADDVAIRLCENTINPTKRFWGPVLATTLVGGVVEPSEDGERLKIAAIRIGDGLIEHIESLDLPGGVSPLLSMDGQVTEISASLCPGPLGQKAVANSEIIQESIIPGGALVISSDGLTRGHTFSVSQKLRDIVGIPEIGLRRGDKTCALAILQEAARHADYAFSGDQDQKLFNDNLSIIALVYDRATARRIGDGKA